ncbi:MAG: hypothetical protein NVSMB3_00820 [Acidobacteriaceae bacterium]
MLRLQNPGAQPPSLFVVGMHVIQVRMVFRMSTVKRNEEHRAASRLTLSKAQILARPDPDGNRRIFLACFPRTLFLS